jgi:hypothetical protein
MAYVESPVLSVLTLDAASVTAPGGATVQREGVFVGDAVTGTQTLCITAAGMLLFPATQTVTGAVTTTFPGTLTVTGAVTVGNFPATQTVTGAVTTTFPATQTVTGVVTVASSTAGLLNAVGQVPISLSATQIIAANTRQGLLITNPSAVTVFIGPSGVTTANGQGLLAGQSLSLPVTSAVYGVVATGTQTVSYLEVV